MNRLRQYHFHQKICIRGCRNADYCFGIGNIHHVDFAGYECVRYLCDNDQAGSEHFEKIIHPNKKDERGWFAPHKDINDFLIKQKTSNNNLFNNTLKSML